MALLTREQFTHRPKTKDPLLSFKWHCVSLPFAMDTTDVESVSLPFPSLNVKPVFGAGKFTYYPGFLELSSFDITFYEDSLASSRRALMAWQERIRHPVEGYYYLPANYKRNIEFELMDTTGKAILSVVLKNCWPTQTNNWDLSYTEDGRLTVQQNFALDGMEYK